jgi:hypothetical protein
MRPSFFNAQVKQHQGFFLGIQFLLDKGREQLNHSSHEPGSGQEMVKAAFAPQSGSEFGWHTKSAADWICPDRG